MTNFELGAKLVEFCKEGKNLEFINAHYADTVTSVEAMESPANPEMPRTLEGIEAVRGKNSWWIENHEIHSANVAGPYPHGDDRFATLFSYDVTFKPTGERMTMEEVGLYTTAGGKITREEFFYHMG